MSGHRVLVVDDERAQREALRQYLTRKGYVVEAVATGEEAVADLARLTYEVLVTDLRLPGMDGLAVVRRARERDEEMGVLLMTAYASVESAVEAMRIGAHDYILKPLILEEVEHKVRVLLDQRHLVRENARLRQALQDRTEPYQMVTESAAMRDVMAWIRRAGASRATVLLTGETGTGKEVVARAIHAQGAGKGEPFLAINLAALPENMVESELFGHERGAFTGAERRREGILRAAGAGSVFLDEIAELPLPAQAKLLRAIEGHEVKPLGSDLAAPFEARLIAATHRDLAAMVAAGAFREDLYYRLKVIEVHLPPLRERAEDVPSLARHLLSRHASRGGVPSPLVTAEAMRALCRHPWRGNIRELSNVLERALILADEGRVDLDQLPDDVREAAGSRGMALTEAIERFERSHIATVLRLSGGNRDRAADELGISPATLYRRIERLGLKGFGVEGRRADDGSPTPG